MKPCSTGRTLTLLFASALLMPAALAGHAVPPDDASAMSIYRDPTLGFTYQYPARFRPKPEMSSALTKTLAGDSSDPGANKMARCITVPLAAFTDAGSTPFGMLYVLRFDNACLGQPASAASLSEAAQMPITVLASFGAPVAEDGVRFQLDGHEAFFVQASAPAMTLGGTLRAASTCALIQQTSVCWLIADMDQNSMPALVSNPITFSGHSAVPLVPKNVFRPW